MRKDVTIFYITGRQLGPLSVPQKWCEECDLTVRAVRNALDELDPRGEIAFEAKAWLRHAFSALRHGGWHPPVLLIDGKVFSQGVVPAADALRSRLRDLLASKRAAAGHAPSGAT